MDYSNENWIKVYTRDTATWKSTSLAARGLALELSRAMGRFSDTISLGARGLRAVTGLVNAPWTEVEPLLQELVDDGRLVYDAEAQTLHDPEHLARQQSTSSPKQRARDARQNRKLPKPKGSRRHAASRGVTRRHDQIEEIEPGEREARAREGAAVAPVETETAGVEPALAPPSAAPAVDEDDLELPAPPALDEPVTMSLLEAAAKVVRESGAVDVELGASWRRYVAWAHEQGVPINPGRWVRWISDDCSSAIAARRVQHEREWRRLGTPKVLGSRNLFAVPDTPPAPYHGAAHPVDEPEERISGEEARAMLKAAGLA